MTELKLKSELPVEPAFSGNENDVGSSEQPCPLKENQDRQRIVEVFFADKEGNRIETITKDEKVDLIVKTENLSGEDLVIDLPENLGAFKFNGEDITEENVLVLGVSSDEEKIELDVQPIRLDAFEKAAPAIQVVYPQVYTSVTDGEFTWEISVAGDEISLTLKYKEELKTGTYKISDIRKYILRRYNWNGMVHMLTMMSDKDSDFNYNRPMGLNGIPSHDDPLIIPDEACVSVIRLQAKKAIDETFKDSPQNKMDEIVGDKEPHVNGKPLNDFAKNILATTYDELIKEIDNTEMAYNGKELQMPNLGTATEAQLYDFFKNLTLARNGLWCGKDKVSTIMSLRRADAKGKTKSNDTFIVFWKENGVKHAQQYTGSSEPSVVNKGKGQLRPQTLTIVLGVHGGSGNSRFIPGGRTRNAYRAPKGTKDALKGKYYFKKGDTSMNLHWNRAGNKNKEFLPNGSFWFKGASYLNPGEGGYTASELGAWLTMTGVFYYLTRWGDGQSILSLVAYEYLKRSAQKLTVSENTESTGFDVKSDDGEVVKSVLYSTYETYVRAHFSDTQLAGLTRKSAAIKLLRRADAHSGSSVTGTTLYSVMNAQQLRDSLETMSVLGFVLHAQLENELDMKQVDGKPGDGTIAKLDVDAVTKAKKTKEIEALRIKAKKDFKAINDLFVKWDSYTQLTSRKVKTITLKEHFKTKVKLQKPGRGLGESVVDIYGGKGMLGSADYAGWSSGCQVITGAERYFNALYNMTKHTKATGQKRWYYSIIDMETIDANYRPAKGS